MKTKLSFFALALCLFGTTQLSAQFSAGAGLVYGFEVEELGIQAVAMYQFTDEIRAAADYIYFFDDVDDASLWEVNLNGHYIFFNDEEFSAYGLAGLNIINFSVDLGPFGDNTQTEVGLNIGAGGQYDVSEKVSIRSELKYSISDADQFLIGVGAIFNFATGN